MSSIQQRNCKISIFRCLKKKDLFKILNVREILSAENKITKTVGTSFSVLGDCVVHNGCILCAAAVLWAMTVFAMLC